MSQKQQQYCRICLENQVNHNIPCKCSLCLHCLINWFEEKNSQNAIHQLKCPLNCNYSYNREQLLQICYIENQQEKIQNILLKEYLKSQDIRPCPSGDCNYYGFVNQNSCEDDLICTKCKYTWQDPSLFPLHMLLEYQIINSINDVGIFIFCFLYTYPCPGCGIQIQKNGGCPHMTCKKCNHQFCWNCKGNWHKHDRVTCCSVFCMFVAFALYFIGNIFYTLSLFQYFLYLIKPFGYLLYVLFVNFALFAFIGGISGAIYLLFVESRRKPIKSLLLGILETLALVIIYYAAIWVNEYLDFTIYAYLYIVSAELILFLIFLAIIFKNFLTHIVGIIIILAISYFILIEGICLAFSIIPLLISRNPLAILIHYLPYFVYYYFCDSDSMGQYYLPYIFVTDLIINILGQFYKRKRN